MTGRFGWRRQAWALSQFLDLVGYVAGGLAFLWLLYPALGFSVPFQQLLALVDVSRTAASTGLLVSTIALQTAAGMVRVHFLEDVHDPDLAVHPDDLDDQEEVTFDDV